MPCAQFQIAFIYANTTLIEPPSAKVITNKANHPPRGLVGAGGAKKGCCHPRPVRVLPLSVWSDWRPILQWGHRYFIINVVPLPSRAHYQMRHREAISHAAEEGGDGGANGHDPECGKERKQLRGGAFTGGGDAQIWRASVPTRMWRGGEQRLRQKGQPAATVRLAAFRRFTHTYAPIPPRSRRLAATWPGSGTALTASELVAETSFTARPVKVTAGVVPVTSPKKFCFRAQSWHDPSI